MSTIRLGVVGVGNMGRNHVRLTQEMSEFDLVGIYDPYMKSVSEFSESGITCFDDATKFMREVEAVVIACPSSQHLNMALLAADCGCHALVEKPLALTKKDAEAIDKAFSKAETILMVGHVERFNPVLTEVEKIINDEKVIAVNARRFSPRNMRISDADVLQDLAIHDLDIIVNLLVPEHIKTVYACGRAVYNNQLIDYAEALIQFDNNVVASIASSRITEDKVRTIDIHTEQSYIQLDLLNKTINITRSTNYKLDNGYSPTYRQENVMERVFIPMVEPLRAELAHFANCINNKKTPITSGKSAIYTLGVLEDIAASIYQQ